MERASEGGRGGRHGKHSAVLRGVSRKRDGGGLMRPVREIDERDRQIDR